MSGYHLVEYGAEVLVLLSVTMIWWPAFKVSRALLVADELGSLATRSGSMTIRTIAGQLKSAAEASTLKWNALDYYLLLGGFMFGVLSSLVKLLYLLPFSPS